MRHVVVVIVLIAVITRKAGIWLLLAYRSLLVSLCCTAACSAWPSAAVVVTVGGTQVGSAMTEYAPVVVLYLCNNMTTPNTHGSGMAVCP
jgi:hypothetical protein